MARGNPMGLLGIELEVLKEKAFALQTTGRKMERLIDELAQLEVKLAPLTGIERWQAVQKHKALRAELQKQRWNMTIQREAMGLRNHDDLDRHYPVPKAITE